MSILQKSIPINAGNSVKMFEINGVLINAEAVKQLSLITVMSLEANKIAVVDFNESQFLNYLPIASSVKFNTAVGNQTVTFTLKQSGITVYSITVNATTIAEGFNFPQLPISNKNILEITCNSNIDFLWVSLQPIYITEKIIPNRII